MTRAEGGGVDGWFAGGGLLGGGAEAEGELFCE